MNGSALMWNRAAAEQVVARLGAAVAPHGCRLLMVGGVANRGYSDKDLDLELHVAAGPRALDRTLAAVDAIRHERHLLVCHIDNQLMFVDAGFRAVEAWLHMPPGFWHQAVELDSELWRRCRADKRKAADAVRRARKHGRPRGTEDVPEEVFVRECNVLADFIAPAAAWPGA